jgi:hypothetical protein
MVGTKRGVESEESRQSARYRLFVEGGDSSIDSQVLTSFFRNNNSNYSGSLK